MKIKFTPSPNQLRIKHLIRNSKKQKFLCDIYISLNRTLSDRIDYPKQFRIRNPIRHSLPKTPSDRIFNPKPFRIKNPIQRGFLKKTLSDRISYPKPFRIENPIRIARRMKSCDRDDLEDEEEDAGVPTSFHEIIKKDLDAYILEIKQQVQERGFVAREPKIDLTLRESEIAEVSVQDFFDISR